MKNRIFYFRWGECNQRQSVTIDDYIKGIKALKPDAIISLHNGDTPEGISNKKVKKITEFNHKCLTKTIEEFAKADISCSIIAPVQGKYDMQWRKVESKYVHDCPVDGYFFEGFHNNGTSSLNCDVNEVTEVLKESVLSNIKHDKPRFMFGNFSPNVRMLINFCTLTEFIT